MRLYHVVALRGILGNKQWYINSSINSVSMRLVCDGEVQCLFKQFFLLCVSVCVSTLTANSSGGMMDHSSRTLYPNAAAQRGGVW